MEGVSEIVNCASMISKLEKLGACNLCGDRKRWSVTKSYRYKRNFVCFPTSCIDCEGIATCLRLPL